MLTLIAAFVWLCVVAFFGGALAGHALVDVLDGGGWIAASVCLVSVTGAIASAAWAFVVLLLIRAKW